MPEHPPLVLSTVATQLAIVAALVLANAFFVAAEFALVSVRRTRIDQLAATGSASAVLLQKSLRDMDRLIGAAQVGITVVSLLLGSYGEKVFEPLLAHLLEWIHLPPVIIGVSRVGIALALAYLVMTALHVIIGEQLPKIVAIQKAETVGLLIVRPMLWFTWICTPLVWVLTHSVSFLQGLIGLKAVDEHGQVHSPEELDILFTQAHEGGQLTTTERELLHRVVKFSEITAREAMLPRVEMKALPVEMTREEFLHYLRSEPHTRVPVYHGTVDEILGIAHLRDLVRFESTLSEANPPEKINLMPILREAPRVPETITIDRLLTEFKGRQQQMAIVIDEYGGTSGLVTLGDLLHQVFGDVQDEFDAHDPEIVLREDGAIRLRGRVLIDEVNELYGLGFRSEDVDTVAGLVMNELGRPAQVGDEVEINGARLLVEEIDRLRIIALRLQLPPDKDSDAERSVAH